MKNFGVYPISLLSDLCNIDCAVQIALLRTKYKYVIQKTQKSASAEVSRQTCSYLSLCAVSFLILTHQLYEHWKIWDYLDINPVAGVGFSVMAWRKCDVFDSLVHANIWLAW